MSEYPPNSTAKIYHDSEGNPRTLRYLVENKPRWAQDIITRYECKIKALEKKLNAIDESIEFFVEEIDKNKCKIRGADFRLGTVYADLHKWTSEIFKWREEVDCLKCLKSNMKMNEAT